MTSTTVHSAPDTRQNLLPVTAATVVGTLALTAVGVFGDGTGGAEADPMEFVVIGALCVALAVAVLLIVVPRALASGRTANLGLGLAIASLPFVLVFWSGIAPALAVGGIVLGKATRRSAEGDGKGAVAIALGALALVGYVTVYVSDWLATNNIGGM